MDSLVIVLDYHLFENEVFKNFQSDFYYFENYSNYSNFRYHKHRIMYNLLSMREHANSLEKKYKKNIIYTKINPKIKFYTELESKIKKNKYKKLIIFEIEDKTEEIKFIKFCKKIKINYEILQTKLFLNTKESFKEHIGDKKKLMLNSFYIEQRKKLKILINKDGKPIGGKWTYDIQNRKKIPKNVKIDEVTLPTFKKNQLNEVENTVNLLFKDNSGSTSNYWIPYDRKSALIWYKDFLNERFNDFGIYQDSISHVTPFLNHSIISVFLNSGLLTPKDILPMAIKKLNKDNLNSVEGFIRQIIGWREFVRGIYQNYNDEQEKLNFFNHKRKLTKHWYEGNTGVEPLDDSIKKVIKYGYAHHIERLMVIGNLMLLLEVDPREVYKWFMELFIDSAPWVMGPNVYGMSQFSDGGIFATKPYISGSNYIFKMSHYKKNSEWAHAWDGLYWNFIDKNRKFLSKNPRLNMMVSMFDKMDIDKKNKILSSAKALQKKITKS
jgi:deoxyribodipyrimidine photolyase-related protein